MRGLKANFLISFFILTNALEDPKVIGGKAIEVVNTILRYAYVGLLLTCFMLSLGNRPQGSKWGYTLAFVGFALLTVYMTVSYFLSFWYQISTASAVRRVLPRGQECDAGSI